MIPGSTSAEQNALPVDPSGPVELQAGPPLFVTDGLRPDAVGGILPLEDTKIRGSRRKKPAKPKQPPAELDQEGPTSNASFQAAMEDPTMNVSPQRLGFLPSNYWMAPECTFSDLVSKFFQRKNNANCRFPHKLYNALAMVEDDQKMYNLLGVKWVDNTVFKVDKLIFGRLLGIQSIDGGLFHRQGNFSSHGFVELGVDDLDRLRSQYDLSDVDMDRVKLLAHKTGMFCKTADEDAVTNCKWEGESKHPRIPPN